jgi:hypothetical protein
MAGNVVPLIASNPSCPGGPCDAYTVSRSLCVLLHRQNMTIARIKTRMPPIAIPAMAPVERLVWCGISAGNALDVAFDVVLGVDVAVEAKELVLEGLVMFIPRKSAAILGSLLSTILARSSSRHPPDAQGLALQHPKNGGFVKPQV